MMMPPGFARRPASPARQSTRCAASGCDRLPSLAPRPPGPTTAWPHDRLAARPHGRTTTPNSSHSCRWVLGWPLILRCAVAHLEERVGQVEARHVIARCRWLEHLCQDRGMAAARLHTLNEAREWHTIVMDATACKRVNTWCAIVIIVMEWFGSRRQWLSRGAAGAALIQRSGGTRGSSCVAVGAVSADCEAAAADGAARPSDGLAASTICAATRTTCKSAADRSK